MAYTNPYVFDPQSSVETTSGSPAAGWTSKFLTPGSTWTKTQNSGIWGSSVWVRRHNCVDSGETRDRCLATYNAWQPDAGDDNGPGDTLWFYEEFYVPSGFSFAGGSWNNMGLNLHHTSGQFGSIGQVPYHLIATSALGGRKLVIQIRGGTQQSTTSGASDQPNNEDFLLEDLQFNHIYRLLVRITLAPNGTPPQRNQLINTNQAGAYIVPLTTGDSHGIIEVWLDDVLKISKRRPTSYRNLSVYIRSGYDRNGAGSNATGQLWFTKLTAGRTRAELFDTITPAVADTFEDGGDSDSGGGGGGTPGPATLPPLTGGKVRYGTFQPGGLPPGSRTSAGADRVRASGPVEVTSDTEIDKAYVYIESTQSGTQVFKLAIWDDDGGSGEPLTRVILSDEVSKTAPFEPTWQQITISPAVELSAGNYWFGIHSGGTGGIISYAYEDVAASYRSATDTYVGGSPTTFPANTSDRFKMAIVLEGTVTGGGGGGSQDTTPPTVVGAETQIPDQIAFQMDEELDTTNAPDADAFVATVDGVNHTPISTSVGTSTVVLSLGFTIPENVVITVDYDKTLATNKVKDLAGNELASFTDQSVDNSIEAPGYERLTAYARTVDPTKRVVDPTNRIVGRTRQIWT